MSEQLPVEIDAVTLADRGRRLQGHLPLTAFKRLAGWLEGTTGEVEFDLAFARGDDNRRWLRGHVTGQFELQCQRCLDHFALPLAWEFGLVLVEAEAEADALPEDMEAVVVGSARAVHTVDLVEDELILALPLIPRCEAVRRCRPAVDVLESERIDEVTEEPRQQPFAGLDDEMPDMKSD